jgi:enoyl-CoA hydratase
MVAVAVADGVATVRLERPGKRNALSIELRNELAGALARCAADQDVRATVLTGSGGAFSAGMDVSQFGGDAANRRALVESTQVWSDALLDHPHPLIAAVNGPALGGGFAMALMCDIRLAAESASFGWPELRMGIPTGYGSTLLAASPAVAADLALSGRIVPAGEALALGLVSTVVPDAELEGYAEARAAQIAALPPGGPHGVKAWIRAGRSEARRQMSVEFELFRSTVLRD